jgi:2-dehydropantoate 2-reductase
MKICIVGAGAIGGLLGARLARAGHEVSFVARGAHLAAMRADGLTLHSREESLTLRVNACAGVDGLGPQDAVFIALKAYGIAAMLPQLSSLLGPQSKTTDGLQRLRAGVCLCLWRCESYRGRV